MAVDEALIQQACDALGVQPVRELRGGGQKTVWLVQRDGAELVLKVISIGSTSPDALRRAQREVELLARLDDPHVVGVRSSLVELGDPVLGAAWLEEYLDGEDLSALLGREWDWEGARAMARDVALGLGAMHRVKVVHRDLSSNNVRRTSAGQYKVLDPGFARHTLLSGITVGGQPGTVGFLSPEHLHNYSGAPTPSSDVFCVGILVFMALSGGTPPIPYRGDDADYLSRVLRAETLDLAAFRNDLEPLVLTLIGRCLHKQPARRFRNGIRLAEALEVLK
jgi:eukaryotic-like serine/threonine-protein kinase